MRIGVMQATSQREKNAMLYECTKLAAKDAEVVNFGVFPDENASISYIETAVGACLLLASGAVDFIVTGCSSGQGMMLAMNSLPGVLCGYLPTPSDAFLFGRINGGNAASLPLGLGYGWMGELNMQDTLRRLFDGEFGCGYPPEEAERKRADTLRLKAINASVKRPLAEALPLLDRGLVKKALSRVFDYIRGHGRREVVELLEKYR